MHTLDEVLGVVYIYTKSHLLSVAFVSVGAATNRLRSGLQQPRMRRVRGTRMSH